MNGVFMFCISKCFPWRFLRSNPRKYCHYFCFYFELITAKTMDSLPERLEIRLKQPNPLFEKWLERWLSEAEKRNGKSQHKLKEALTSLRKYPLPLQSGRECGILRGFGVKLCALIDEELRNFQTEAAENPANISSIAYHAEVREIVASVKKAKRQRKSPTKQPTAPKLTKKQLKAIADEEERQRPVNLAPGHFRICLLVDIQETSGKNKRQLDQTRGYLESLGVEYEVRRLTVGDFLWIAKGDGGELVLPYIVERKRMDDLASSIRDGRFHEQKHRLRNCGIQNVIYLVEDYGDNEHVGLPIENLQQAMVNTQIHANFKIVHTKSNWHSMLFLKNMCYTLIRLYKDKMLLSVQKDDLQPSQPTANMMGLLKFRDLYEDSARNAQLTVREVFVQQLLQLHSLSLERALAIVELYPTPRLLFDAYDACLTIEEAQLLLSKIPVGPLQRPIGDQISKTIHDFYKTIFLN